MGKPKPKFAIPPDTKDIVAYRNFKPERDPRTPYIFGERKRRFAESYSNPLGAYTTPDVRDKSVRAANQQIDQDYAAASQADNYAFNQLQGNQLANLASLTRPQFYQSQPSPLYGLLGAGIGAGASVASGGLAGKNR